MKTKRGLSLFFERVRHAPGDVYRGFRQELRDQPLRAGGKTTAGVIYTVTPFELIRDVLRDGLIANPSVHENMPGYMIVGAAVSTSIVPIAAAESFRRTGVRARQTKADAEFLGTTFE